MCRPRHTSQYGVYSPACLYPVKAFVKGINEPKRTSGDKHQPFYQLNVTIQEGRIMQQLWLLKTRIASRSTFIIPLFAGLLLFVSLDSCSEADRRANGVIRRVGRL